MKKRDLGHIFRSGRKESAASVVAACQVFSGPAIQNIHCYHCVRTYFNLIKDFPNICCQGFQCFND